ncbi:hypothetical protein AVEN_125675-1 [Araneus ventricosus]|uniref:Uncharacterized protein n=1 Tax=Araneus ventricosus TaxID=182803 RepID=A0A4Y2Q6Y0_ARAVE|nr:hypothetical protein AVEN_78164-1 [Araneus ventricosus]GBN59191.1 hypothetical protein AVEN_125675-1 [Araneus ventricosus]
MFVLDIQSRKKWSFDIPDDSESRKELSDIMKKRFEKTLRRILRDERRSPVLTGADPSIGCRTNLERDTLKETMGLHAINFKEETRYHEMFWRMYGDEIEELAEKQKNIYREELEESMEQRLKHIEFYLNTVADYMEKFDAETGISV